VGRDHLRGAVNEIWTQARMYIWYALCLVEILYLHLVPVLAPNYKQHILSPAKARFLSVSQHADK
jgi:hypothetical protein